MNNHIIFFTKHAQDSLDQLGKWQALFPDAIVYWIDPLMTQTAPRTIIKFGNELHGAACFCEHCQQNKMFEVPSELVDLFVDGKIVLFVGSGVSTESKGIMHDSFYETISHISNNTDLTLPFPDAMQNFCTGPSGKVELIKEIKNRFDYIYSHKSLYDEATRFHRELATFFPIDTIVTTNWDTYFEDECAATPFVEDRDIALWDVATRKVLKIHGTIANFGSIVATRADYDKCKRRLQTGILGGHLKSLLASKTVVFIGYSLRDEDFLQIYGAVRKHLADFHRQAYFVAPEIQSEDRKRLEKLDLHLIETDGQFFISELKNHAHTKQCICPDEMYTDVAVALDEIMDAQDWLHETFKTSKHPQTLICSWYQDGLRHALQRILRLRKTGEYSDLHRLIWTADSYRKKAIVYRKAKNYSDSSYCSGYANGFKYASLPASDRKKFYFPPPFFYFDYLGWSKSQYRRDLAKLPMRHQGAFKYVQKTANKYPKEFDLVLSHKDQL